MLGTLVYIILVIIAIIIIMIALLKFLFQLFFLIPIEIDPSSNVLYAKTMLLT
jgi:hypothetical protein